MQNSVRFLRKLYYDVTISSEIILRNAKAKKRKAASASSYLSLKIFTRFLQNHSCRVKRAV